MNPIHLTREHSLYTTFSERAIQARQREMARLNEQLGTGKRVNRASDDPTAFSQARRVEVLSERYGQYQRSIGAARTWTDSTQQALDDLANLFAQAQEAGLRAANGAFPADAGETVAKQLESIMTEVVDTLNSKSGDEYLFAGSRTTVQPFVEDAGVIEYEGNANGRKRTIGQDITLNINISGDRVHDLDGVAGGPTITSVLQNLVDAVRAGDQTAVTSALQGVETARDHVIELGAESGTIGNRLALAEEQVADALVDLEGRQSDLEDADIADVIMRFHKEQLGLNAALQSAASILQTSILDYLR